DGDDPREDGPVDEEPRHGLDPSLAQRPPATVPSPPASGPAAEGAAEGAVVPSSVACTTVPGRAFCRPSTMTRSPARRPSSTSQRSPMARDTVTLRASTLPSGSTTRALASPVA